jgi:outer membrane lipoprotein-sorting protein
MRIITRIAAFVLISIFIFNPVVFSQTAREIMQVVNDRDDGFSQVSRIQLSTCRYRMKNRKIKCAENPRIKVMESVRKDFGKDGKDTRSVIIILEPAGEKGIGFLQFDYDDPLKETDQWMYFSVLGKVKRIISGDADEPNTGSFFGTEISYEDMEARQLDDYTYRIIEAESYQKRPCWVIESIPTPSHAAKSNYSKTISWIDKERNLSLKSILYNRQGRRVKRITNSRLEKLNGVWVMGQMLVNNLETKRLTVFKLNSTILNIGIDDRFLSKRTLTDRVFRQKNLKKYRSTLK